jgi:homoaconitate hydratase
VAPRALQAAGIKAVIAKSFAFIYARNQVNNGLLGIKIRDKAFYERAAEGQKCEIDVDARAIHCGGARFPFRLDPIEKELLESGGLMKVYERFGRGLFGELQGLAVRGEGERKWVEILDAEKEEGRMDW